MNKPRLQERMRADGLDAVVATAPENVTYTSGFWAMSQWIRRGPQVYVLVPREDRGELALVASTGTLDLLADQDVEVSDVHRYGFFAIEADPLCVDHDPRDQRVAAMLRREDEGDAVSALVSAIRDRGLESASIGVDEIGIVPQYLDKLAAALPKARISRAAEIFRHARSVKTPEEVRRLRRSAHVAELSIEAALAVAREGATERELANAFHGKTITEGGMPVLGVICTGPRSALSSGQPTDRKLERGDVIRFDVGGRVDHYRADISRIAVLHEASEKVRTYHKAIRAGLLHAYELIRPGVRTADVFNAVVQTVRSNGLPHYRRNHVGHGIGLDGYDAPNLTPGSNEVFEEGNVICVETPYYEMGFAGLQVEDMLRVTRDGVESLMSTSSELRIV
ncbi:MAG TPA: Xaa-Pro peptidase family protein [Burkholderiaceae bacterium]|nr:Xaa-Pro peptidase family protein [Burkholderiaceae bacterium]